MTRITLSVPIDADRNSANRKLVEAAHEFEAQMLKELLKPMTSNVAEESDGALGAHDGFVELAAESLGRGLSNRGGIGIADRVIRSLSHSETGQGKAP